LAYRSAAREKESIEHKTRQRFFKNLQQFGNILKTKVMGNLLYLIAVILLIGWVFGFFVYNVGGIIHVLLIIALVAVILRIIQGRKLFD
jgi:hypothetical protein